MHRFLIHHMRTQISPQACTIVFALYNIIIICSSYIQNANALHLFIILHPNPPPHTYIISKLIISNTNTTQLTPPTRKLLNTNTQTHIPNNAPHPHIFRAGKGWRVRWLARGRVWLTRPTLPHHKLWRASSLRLGCVMVSVLGRR